MDAYAADSKLKKKRSSNAALNKLYELSQSNNIAAELDDQELTRIGKLVCEEFDIDLTSRDKWEQTAKKAMEVALQVRKPKNYPFANASNVKWPLITVAALQFNARSYPEICSSDGIVKARVVGKDDGIPQMQDGQPVLDQTTGEPAWQVPPGAKAEKAERISEHMSYQLSEEMTDWEGDMDTLLMQLPIVGDVVKKVYHTDDGNVSEMISAMDFIVNQSTKSLKSCPRATHRFRLYPFEIEERKADGRYLDVDYYFSATTNDKDEPQEFLEQHRRLDLDEDGYGEPYIVTVHKASEKVCRIVANFEPEGVVSNEKRILKVTPKAYFVNYVFIPDPDGGFYGIGFGSLLESLGAAIDTTINQMLDAGHLQNAGGGFIGSGVRLKKNVIRQEPGLWTVVSASGDNLRNAIVPHMNPGPSAVLFNLLGLMIDASKDITAVKDILTGDSPQGETATTTLARIEQGMKVFTAIYKRVYRSLKQEFRLLFALNAKYLKEDEYFNVLDTQKAVSKSDYDDNSYDVCPVADPRLVTDMQRVKRAEALFATIQLNPAGTQEILRRYYTAIGAEDVDKLLPPQQPDPMQELQLAGAKATVEKTSAEAELTQAKTQETMSGIDQEAAKIGQEDTRLHLAALEGVDAMTKHEDEMSHERASMVLDHANAAKDREQQGALAKENAKAKRKGQE